MWKFSPNELLPIHISAETFFSSRSRISPTYFTMLQFAKKACSSSLGLFHLLRNHRALKDYIYPTASATHQHLDFLSTRNSGAEKPLPVVERVQSHFTPLPNEQLALGYKPRLADRPYIPGSFSEGFPEFLSGPKDGESLPAAYQAESPQAFDVYGWSQICRQLIDARLPECGALLIRWVGV